MSVNEISKEWIQGFKSLDEPQERWFAAIKSMELGYGGVSIVSRATGLSRTTITQGYKEIKSKKLTVNCEERLRKEGAGRKQLTSTDPRLVHAIENILEETSAGDPMSQLKWACKSTRKIEENLLEQGFAISNVTVMNLLKKQGYSLQSNKKMLSGKDHPDRDAQFKYINKIASRFASNDCPIISVDTKKKELTGNFKN